MAYRCTSCDHDHDGLPELGMHAPDPYLAVPEAERAARTTFTEDRCTVRDEDGEHYFVRGVLLLRIHGENEPWALGLWVSQSRANFERYSKNDTSLKESLGWVVNRVAHYDEDTFLLKARLVFLGSGARPLIELEPTNHPLAVEQRNGITLDRAWQIVHEYLPN